ncbi:hypothetical protein G4G28_13930 [Massilia sp. Dwa41.01b]|uniref:lysozyme inhibitor LprI family protein n=1 Tax=Massilia sp. Dwa41.01b TaxID=2709302 RepID=UPI0015FF14AD|nr:hypothetical protein [Massilia sp. Dwa41.01b]QNA89288.1 hypothetical protein G4G28_13930 [Massilia sp. Dwa41.01b]
MNHRSTTLLLTSLFAAGLLAYKNPTLGDFGHYARQHIRTMAQSDGANDPVGALIGEISGPAVTAATSRSDFVFFSSFSGQEFGYRWRVLGIAGNFVPLEIAKMRAPAEHPVTAPPAATALALPAAEPEPGNPVSPSYDCSQARVFAERVVCADAPLAYQDRLVAALYAWQRSAAAAAQRQPLLDGQRTWLARRNACTTVDCVSAAYTQRIALLLDTQPPAGALPLRRGQCMHDSIARIGQRLEVSGAEQEGSGTRIEYRSGLQGVSYETEPEVARSRPGDPVLVCLHSVPADCPPGDDRGSEYAAFNRRTGEAWTLPDSQHSCGGA